MMFLKDPSNQRSLSDLLQDTIYSFNNIPDDNLTPHYENIQQSIKNLKAILDEYYTTYERYYNCCHYVILIFYLLAFYLCNNESKFIVKYLFNNIICSNIIDNLQSVLISGLEQLYHSIPPIEEGLNKMQQFLIKDLPRFTDNIEASSNEPKELCGNFSILSVKSFFFLNHE